MEKNQRGRLLAMPASQRPDRFVFDVAMVPNDEEGWADDGATPHMVGATIRVVALNVDDAMKTARETTVWAEYPKILSVNNLGQYSDQNEAGGGVH